MNKLEGKVVLVTGAKGGLGSCVTSAFLEAGAGVVGVSRSIQAADVGPSRFRALPAARSSRAAARKGVEAAGARFQRVVGLVPVMVGFAVGADSASEAAVIALVRAVALENKDREISANVVLPARMDTPGNRASDPKAGGSQWVQPAQVAALLVCLASDAGAQVTGGAIPVYGRQL